MGGSSKVSQINIEKVSLSMFGFSFAKLAVLIAIVAAVWYVFKATGRRRDLNEVAIKNGKIKRKSRLPQIIWLILLISLITFLVIWGLKPYI